MTNARNVLVDLSVTPYYHCISRCVRRAFLCGEGYEHRKQWIEDRLRELAGIFAIDVCGFSVLDNELHVLLRLDSARSQALTALQVAENWLTLCPARDSSLKPMKLTPQLLKSRADDVAWVAESRQRLSDLGSFMKFLKEPISRRANKEDGCTGTFWEGRFKSIAILDEASLLATCVYIDLNPAAAGLASTPEKSSHTSLKSRIDMVKSAGKLDKLRDGSPYVSKVQLEKDHWLFPIEDKRRPDGSGLAGMLRGISLTGYLQLVDWSSRLVRTGKSPVATDAPEILNRLQIDVNTWQSTLKKLTGPTKRIGSYFGNSDRLKEVATQRDHHFLINVTGRNSDLTAPRGE